MDLEFRGSNPLTYIVGEHARAVLAIQDLQREVNALLNFRDYVLHALPHLKSRAAPEGVSSEGTTQAAPHSAVVDSGFSTDKASTSMGKSSSFSGGETCGESRWASTDHEETLDEGELSQPLGSCEDELWQLLEVIQRKGTRLRSDLERAEMSEREHLPNSCENNKQKTHDFWPHSLPPPGPGQRYDYYGFEPFAEVDRLRLDRSYLLSRISKAENETAVSHARLIDLHTQMMGLSSEKRRLEDALHVTVQDASKIDSYVGYHPSSKIMIDHGARIGRQRSSVMVNSGEPPYPHNLTWIEEDIMLPRILKVPIRDKGDERTTQKTKENNYSTGMSSKDSPAKVNTSDDAREVTSNQTANYARHTDGAPLRQTSVSQIGSHGSNADRVVIERQRTCSKVDGGLSMPTSLLKGNKIKVNPDKQRISAILREKDVLALQKQLLTTVMETEVLKKQLESCSEEWVEKCSQFEQGQKKNCDLISSLNEENRLLKHKLETLKNIPRSDVGVMAKPATHNVSVSTDKLGDGEPTSMYEAPNVKYDVVVHEDVPKGSRGVEKPPRKRVLGPRLSSCSADVSFGSRESASSPRGNSRSYPKQLSSVGRITPTSTPTSSLTTRHSRSSSSSSVAVRRDVTTRMGVGSVPPPASLRSQPFNKVPFVNDSTLPFGGAGSIFQKSSNVDVRPESFIPRATSQLGYSTSTRVRHLPKAPAVAAQTKYLPIDKSPRAYNRYSTGPGSSSGIPSLIRSYVRPDSPKTRDLCEEQDKSDCSLDEVNPMRGTETVRHKALWRKPSGAVRIRNVGRPSVMSSYLGKQSLG